MAIVLFTDFGANDLYAGQVEAVLDAHAPGVRVIHLLHEAPQFNARAAAHLLAALALGLPPDNVIIGVVDPGVGTERWGVIVRADRNTFVGPDNGLFSVAAARATTRMVWRLVRHPPGASPSFHGRDVFAPVAATLATGGFPHDDAAPTADLDVRFAADDLAEVIYIDHYGNAYTGIRARGVSHTARLVANGCTIAHAHVFGDVPPGALFWYENSSGLVEIAANQASAATELALRIGQAIAWSA
jgi:S-adenosylmethionine hydrolase